VFWLQFAEQSDALLGTCAEALQDVAKPEPKETRSAAASYVLRIGDVNAEPDSSIEIAVKATKATAVVRPPSMKKFSKRPPSVDEDGVPVPVAEGEEKDVYGLLKSHSEFVSTQKLQAIQDKFDDAKEEYGDKIPEAILAEIEMEKKMLESIPKENLVKSYKYGATWVDVEDTFERLELEQGIDICAFFPAENVCFQAFASSSTPNLLATQISRDLFMSELQFVWADPGSGKAQVALSALVQAMYQKDLAAICRWVTRAGSDPKMGILVPRLWDNIDSLSWVQVNRRFPSPKITRLTIAGTICRRFAEICLSLFRYSCFK
jgi:ATP-dependent DNA helicase 2 subunit 2